MTRIAHTRLPLAIGALVSVLGCPTPHNPCANDAFGCQDDDGEFALDPECTLDGELTVVAGWGLDEFHTFESRPVVHDGFQGGQHLFLGVRVPDDEITEWGSFLVQLRTFATVPRDSCDAAVEAALTYGPEDLPPALRDDFDADGAPEQPVFVRYGEEDEWLPVVGESRCLDLAFERIIELGDDEDLIYVDDGTIELVGVLLEIPWTDDERDVVVVADVLDRCGRTGFDYATFPN